MSKPALNFEKLDTMEDPLDEFMVMLQEHEISPSFKLLSQKTHHNHLLCISTTIKTV